VDVQGAALLHAPVGDLEGSWRVGRRGQSSSLHTKSSETVKGTGHKERLSVADHKAMGFDYSYQERETDGVRKTC